MKTKPALLTLLLSLAIATTAFADGDDEVTLKNGGSIRGTVVAVEPGSRVVILELGGKEPRTLSWAEVADVQKGKFARAEPGPAATGYSGPPPAKTASPEAERPGVVKVHIDSDRPVQLIEETGTSVGAVGGYVVTASQIRPVCMSPCDRLVDGSRGQAFTIVGDGVPTPEPFRLSDHAGDTTIRVEAGSVGLRVGGSVLGTLGILGLLGGTSILVIGAVLEDGEPTLVAAGAATTGASAAALAGGIAMMIVGRTDLEVTSSGPARAGAPAKPTARAPRYWAGEF